MSFRELCSEEEWLAAYGTRRQLEIFQPVIDAFRDSRPTAINITYWGGYSYHAGHSASRMCIAFHGAANERFFIDFQKNGDADMFVQWSEKYLRMHGARMGLLSKYENLPEPVIYDLAAEQSKLKQVNQLPSLNAADAWL